MNCKGYFSFYLRGRYTDSLKGFRNFKEIIRIMNI